MKRVSDLMSRDISTLGRNDVLPPADDLWKLSPRVTFVAAAAEKG